MAKKEKRFVQTHVESSVFENTAIWVDRETGVIICGTLPARPVG